MDPDATANTAWSEQAQHIKTCAESTLGATKPGRRFIDKQTWWWNEEVQKTIKDKKNAYKIWGRTRDAEDLKHYRELKSIVK